MKCGKLYLCATPIGNLEDLSIRALRTLIGVDMIAAEDTRVSMKLLNSFNIKASVYSYHEHNKKERGEYIINCLLKGIDVALISDAGTPCISDPGYDLVNLARDAGIEIESIPGACACIDALTLSGMPADKFVFEGFLSRKNKERKKSLSSLERETRTMVFYESPHHLLDTLQDLCETLGGDRKIFIARELTKHYEETQNFTLLDALKYYTDCQPRGEFVLVVAGISKKNLKQLDKKLWENMTLSEHMKFYTSQGIEKKETMKRVAQDRDMSKREVYQALLEIEN